MCLAAPRPLRIPASHTTPRAPSPRWQHMMQALWETFLACIAGGRSLTRVRFGMGYHPAAHTSPAAYCVVLPFSELPRLPQLPLGLRRCSALVDAVVREQDPCVQIVLRRRSCLVLPPTPAVAP